MTALSEQTRNVSEEASPEAAASASLDASPGLGRLGKQALIYAAGTWAVRAASFLLVPLYTRQMSPDHFGLYELLARTFDVLCLVLPAGIVTSLLRFYGLAEERKKKQTASTAILGPVAIGAAASLGLWLLRDPLARLVLHDTGYAPLVVLLGLWVWAEIVFNVSCGLLRARGQAGLYSGANVARSLLTIGLALCLVWWRHLGLTGAMLANTLSSVLSALFLTGYALVSVGFRPSLSCLRSQLAFALPLMVTAVLSATLASNRFILNAYMGPTQVAVLGVAGRVSMLLSVLATSPIGLSYMPFVFSTAARRDAPAVFGRAAVYIAVLVAGVSLALALFAPEIVAVLAPTSYRAAVVVARVGLASGVLASLAPQVEIGIYLSGRTFWKIPSVLILTATSFALNLLLIPRYGPLGASVAGVGAQATYLVALYAISRRLYPIPYDWRRLAKVAATTAALWLAGCGAIPGLPFTSAASRVLVLLLFPVVLWSLGTPADPEAARIRRFVSGVHRSVSALPATLRLRD